MKNSSSKNKAMKSSVAAKMVSGYLIGAVPYSFSISRWVDGAKIPRRSMRPGEFPINKKPCGGTLRDFILGFLRSSSSFKELKERLSGIYVVDSSIDTSNAQELRCIVCAGKYGLEEELINVKSKKQKRKDLDDCALMEYNLRFVFSPNHEDAIVIMERYGKYSPATMFFDALSRYVVSTLPKTLEARFCSSIISNLEYIQKQYTQRVKALHFITHTIPHDISDHLHGDSDLSKECIVDIRVSARRNKFLTIPGFVRQFSSLQKRGMTIGGSTYEDVKMELKIGNRTHTVIAGDDSFRMIYDITDKVTLRSNRHPTPSSFVGATSVCLEESQKTLGWKE